MIRVGTRVRYAEYFDADAVDVACHRRVTLGEIGTVTEVVSPHGETDCRSVRWDLGGNARPPRTSWQREHVPFRCDCDTAAGPPSHRAWENA